MRRTTTLNLEPIKKALCSICEYSAFYFIYSPLTIVPPPMSLSPS